MKLLVFTSAIPVAILASTAAVTQEPEGARVFSRCAACHLPTGAGIPGAFPPLTKEPANLARTPDGRRYLVLALLKGLSGPIVVEGKAYSGVMPAQTGLTDTQVAAALNHVTGPLSGVDKPPRPFTAAEIATARAAARTLDAAAVARSQPRQRRP